MITDLAGLTTALSTKARADVDAVVIETASTLTMSQLQGLGIVGRGAGYVSSVAGFGVRTVIKWTGATDPTAVVLNVDQALACFLRDLSIDGDSKAGIGIKSTSSEVWGTTGLELSHVNFRNCTAAGIQLGNAAGDNGNDHTTLHHVSFRDCGTGIRSVSHQAVVHTLINPWFEGVGTLLDFQKGGNVKVFGGHAGQFDLALSVGYGGVNACKFCFSGTRFEMGGYTNRYANLLDASAAVDMCDASFEDCQETEFILNSGLVDNSTSYRFRLGAKAQCNLLRHLHSNRRVAQVVGGATFTDSHGRWAYHLPTATNNFSMAAGAGNIIVRYPVDGSGNLLSAHYQE